MIWLKKIKYFFGNAIWHSDHLTRLIVTQECSICPVVVCKCGHQGIGGSASSVRILSRGWMGTIPAVFRPEFDKKVGILG